MNPYLKVRRCNLDDFDLLTKDVTLSRKTDLFKRQLGDFFCVDDPKQIII